MSGMIIPTVGIKSHNYGAAMSFLSSPSLCPIYEPLSLLMIPCELELVPGLVRFDPKRHAFCGRVASGVPLSVLL